MCEMFLCIYKFQYIIFNLEQNLIIDIEIKAFLFATLGEATKYT